VCGLWGGGVLSQNAAERKDGKKGATGAASREKTPRKESPGWQGHASAREEHEKEPLRGRKKAGPTKKVGGVTASTHPGTKNTCRKAARAASRAFLSARSKQHVLRRTRLSEDLGWGYSTNLKNISGREPFL